jgi:hypothetical protein
MREELNGQIRREREERERVRGERDKVGKGMKEVA